MFNGYNYFDPKKVSNKSLDLHKGHLRKLMRGKTPDKNKLFFELLLAYFEGMIPIEWIEWVFGPEDIQKNVVSLLSQSDDKVKNFLTSIKEG